MGWRPGVVKQQPEEIPDADHELVIGRVCAIDVAKASGAVCVRLPDSAKPARRVSRVWQETECGVGSMKAWQRITDCVAAVLLAVAALSLQASDADAEDKPLAGLGSVLGELRHGGADALHFLGAHVPQHLRRFLLAQCQQKDCGAIGSRAFRVFLVNHPWPPNLVRPELRASDPGSPVFAPASPAARD